MGRTTGIANVEISALINLGLDYLALGQHARAVSYLAPTLDRVEREAFGRPQMAVEDEALHRACRAVLYHRGRMTKPYAMWKRDSKKPREPPHRNTSLSAGHCVARSSQSSEMPTQQAQNCNEPSRLRNSCRAPRSSTRLRTISDTGTKDGKGTGSSSIVWQSQSHYRADGNGCGG